MQQGPYENIITYEWQCDIALKAYQDQGNREMEGPGFFDGLDNSWYANFMKSILNGMTAGSMMQSATLSDMYLLANL